MTFPRSLIAKCNQIGYCVQSGYFVENLSTKEESIFAISNTKSLTKTAGNRIKTATKKMKVKMPLTMSLFAAIGLFLFTSCIKQPTASFSVSNSSPKTGESVYFTNTSLDADSYEWDFGDGTSSSMMNPSHTYYSSGSKLVCMTAYSKNRKKSATATALVDVKAVGDVMFWTDESTTYNITVELEKVGTKTITNYYYYTPSDCGASGCATYYDLEAGTYHFTAENLLYYWSGYVTVEADNCKKMLLYHSKAEKQLHPENQSTERLIKGVDQEEN